MLAPLLPELRPYLERLLDDALAHSEMTFPEPARREWMLCLLQKELVHFLFTRVMTTFPPPQRRQFVALLEQEASEEALQALTRRHIADIPAFVTQSLQEFRARFLPSEHQRP